MLTSVQPSSLENMPVIQLLSGLEDIGAVDPHVALTLLPCLWRFL